MQWQWPMTRCYFILTMQIQLDGWSCHTASSVGYLLASFCCCHGLYLLLWPTLMPSKSSELTAGKTKCQKQHRKFALSQYSFQKKTGDGRFRNTQTCSRSTSVSGLETHKYVQEAQVSHTRFWGWISKHFCNSMVRVLNITCSGGSPIYTDSGYN